MTLHQRKEHLLKLAFGFQRDEFIPEMATKLVHKGFNQELVALKLVVNQGLEHSEKVLRSEVVVSVGIYTETGVYLGICVDKELGQGLWG